MKHIDVVVPLVATKEQLSLVVEHALLYLRTSDNRTRLGPLVSFSVIYATENRIT